MALSLNTAPPRDSVVVILEKDHPRPQTTHTQPNNLGRSMIEVECIWDAIDRLSDFTTDSWPDVLLVRGGSANMLPLMAEVCRTAGVRLVSEREHAGAMPPRPLQRTASSLTPE